MSVKFYILKNKTVVEVDMPTYLEWTKTNPDRYVARDRFGKYVVSTVFLTLDHNFEDKGPPVLFETMIFEYGDFSREVYMNRYSTWEGAVCGHRGACAHARYLHSNRTFVEKIKDLFLQMSWFRKLRT